ncbi:MAG TPA: hypothetical protein VFO38_06180 [Candidatus Saccharimonadales bacterium]|nr:hypothetical protein [Candidatus Saccharimonadales bacterium]
MSHYQHGEEFRTPKGRTLERSGRVWGCNYFSHNSCGLTKDAPFCDLEVKVEKNPPSGGKPASYTLTLLDNVDPVGAVQSALPLPRNHTESRLVYNLTGAQRPLQKITTIVEFEAVDGLVQFDFEWIINKFGALRGLDIADIKPPQLAWRFYQHMLNRRFGSCLGVTFPHSSGAAVALDSPHGIHAYELGPHQGIHKLVKRTGAVLSGPLQPSCERPYICAEFLGNGQVDDQQLIDMFQKFKAACLDSSN